MKYLILILLFFCGGAWAQTPAAPTNFTVSTNPVALSIAGLHRVGNQILNSAGQQVSLHGADIDGTDTACIYGSIFGAPTGAGTDGAAAAAGLIPGLLSWNINIVRITLNDNCWLGINGLPASPVTGAEYRAQIMAYMNAFNAAGIAVIMDDQYTSPGSTPAIIINSGYNTFPTPTDNTLAFWTNVAGTSGIASNGSILFDLLNEPSPENFTANTIPDAWECLLSGGVSTSGPCAGANDPFNSTQPAPYNPVGFQTIVTAIRNAGASNIIMISCPTYGVVCDQWLNYLPTDSLNNFVNTVHLYPGQECQGQSACWVPEIQPILAQYPVIIGETGDDTNVYTSQLLSWFDAHAAGSHYLGWAFNNVNTAPLMIQNYNVPVIPTLNGLGFQTHYAYTAGAAAPTPAPVTFFCSQYPCGIRAGYGGTQNYIGSDGTVYLPDTPNSGMTEVDAPRWTSPDTFTNTSDPTLYATGKSGGEWFVNVPNGNYSVTFGLAPNMQGYNQGACGQAQTINGDQVSPASGQWNPHLTLPNNCLGGGPNPAAPAIDEAVTVTWTNGGIGYPVYNQQLIIETAPAFDASQYTMINMIRIVQVSLSSGPPNAPTGLTATPAANQVVLNWTDGGNGATAYSILRSSSLRGVYVPIDIVSSWQTTLVTTYTDTNVVNGTTYYYAVNGSSGSGTGPSSNTVSATPGSGPPGIPTGLSATPENQAVSLTWTAGANNATFKVLRSTTSGSGYAQVATPSTAYYTDTGLTNGTTYYYVVEGVNGSGTASGNSSQVSATPNPAPTGTWYNVTPSNIDLVDALDCQNYGVQTVQADYSNPGTLYVQANCQGLWKSTDYGQTWSGPINTGTNANGPAGAGGITVNPSATMGGAPAIYAGTFRSHAGAATGFWVSNDYGVDWTQIVPLGNTALGFYAPVVDPYARTHLLMAVHEEDEIVESTDGGNTWANISFSQSGGGGTDFIWFIDTGTAGTPGTHSSGGTANTWLWMAQAGGAGTYRTANGGTSWTQVSTNTHPHGAAQIYDVGSSNNRIDGFTVNGVVYMCGVYAAGGFGILRSTDYGQTWTNIGNGIARDNIIGTSKDIYGMDGGAVGLGVNANAGFELGAQPGTGTFSTPTVPSGLYQASAQFAAVNDGTHNIIVGAMWGAGIWRYIEP